ncbi:unnamed protein product [Closterium sp. NIES-65]|nr:unnamed protein product [Closterium sp. NIES-65]
MGSGWKSGCGRWWRKGKAVAVTPTAARQEAKLNPRTGMGGAAFEGGRTGLEALGSAGGDGRGSSTQRGKSVESAPARASPAREQRLKVGRTGLEALGSAAVMAGAAARRGGRVWRVRLPGPALAGSRIWWWHEWGWEQWGSAGGDGSGSSTQRGKSVESGPARACPVSADGSGRSTQRGKGVQGVRIIPTSPGKGGVAVEERGWKHCVVQAQIAAQQHAKSEEHRECSHQGHPCCGAAFGGWPGRTDGPGGTEWPARACPASADGSGRSTQRGKGVESVRLGPALPPGPSLLWSSVWRLDERGWGHWGLQVRWRFKRHLGLLPVQVSLLCVCLGSGKSGRRRAKTHGARKWGGSVKEEPLELGDGGVGVLGGAEANRMRDTDRAEQREKENEEGGGSGARKWGW